MKEAEQRIDDAKRVLAQVREEHLKEIRQIELSGAVSFLRRLCSSTRPSIGNLGVP